MLSSLRFGSLLVYSPQGTSEKSVTAKNTCSQIKRAAPTYLDRLAELAAREDQIADLLAGALLVPAPGSAPLKAHAIWAPERICQELLRHGLGTGVAPWLARVKAVKKSAYVSGPERPKAAEHYESIAVSPPGSSPSVGRIVVVDDVITRGATLLAACSRVSEAFPGCDVVAFAAVRTMTGSEIARIVDPTLGDITLRPNGDTLRAP